MPSQFVYIAGLVLLYILWRLFGKRLMAFFLLSFAGRTALKTIGSDAVSKQPDWVKLTPEPFPRWTNRTAIEEFTRSLVANGFSEVGVFNVDKMPGVKIDILVNPGDYVTAHVCEHPQAGVWIELVTRYTDGRSHTLTTMKSTGLDSPSWVTTIRAEKAPANQLVQQLVRHRKPGEMVRVPAERAVKEFEEGYAKYMLWRKNTKIRPEEVTQIVRDWADKKDAAARGAAIGT